MLELALVAASASSALLLGAGRRVAHGGLVAGAGVVDRIGLLGATGDVLGLQLRRAGHTGAVAVGLLVLGARAAGVVGRVAFDAQRGLLQQRVGAGVVGEDGVAAGQRHESGTQQHGGRQGGQVQGSAGTGHGDLLADCGWVAPSKAL